MVTVLGESWPLMLCAIVGLVGQAAVGAAVVAAWSVIEHGTYLGLVVES